MEFFQEVQQLHKLVYKQFQLLLSLGNYLQVKMELGNLHHLDWSGYQHATSAKLLATHHANRVGSILIRELV